MNRYCEGTLGGICRFAESIRPGTNPKYLHSMDAYLIGEPTPSELSIWEDKVDGVHISARIALMMIHNNHYHRVTVAVQSAQLQHFMTARAQELKVPNNYRAIVEGVIVIMKQIESDPMKRFGVAQASLNW